MRGLFFLFFVLASFSARSQAPYFEKVFGTRGNDAARSVKQLPTGSIYVLGDSDTLNAGDISLTKLDSHGNLLWTQYYGTPRPENGFYLNLASDGNLVFTGESETGVNNLDILIYKVDTSGAVIWNKTYATPLNETAKYIGQASDGGYILAGAQNDAFGMNDMLALKLDAGGDYQWSQTFGRNDNEYAAMIRQQGTGYILTGDTKSFGAGGYDVILYRLDSLGNEVWSQTYGDSLNNGCQGLLVTSGGAYLSYGETEIAPFSAFDFFLQKIDTAGLSLWRHTYGGTGTDAVFSVQEDDDGGFVCTGYSNSYNGSGPLDLVIFKVDSAGTFLWKQTYGGSGIDIGYEIIRAADHNGFIIAGKTFRDTDDDDYLLKLDSNGLVSGIGDMAADPEGFLRIYPDPASDEATVCYRLRDGKNSRLILCDMTGKKLSEQLITLPEGTISISVSGLSSGIYFYSLVQEGRVVAIKKLAVY